MTAGAAGGVLLNAPPAGAQPLHPAEHILLADGAEGGEGGEGGAAGHAAQPATSSEDQQSVLAQMQGHLLVAEELLNRGDARGAEPHVGHPVDELYDSLEPAIAKGQLPPFRDSLEALRQQVRLDPSATATAQKLSEARQAIQAATLKLSPNLTSQPTLVLAVVRQLALTAASEYEGAVDGTQIHETIDYQNARGFLLEADRLISQTLAASPTSAQILQPARERITAMLQAFPSAKPPQRALLSVSALESLAEGI